MMCEHIRHKISRKDKDAKAPYLAAAKNFVLAKKLHKENLEHVPLPDTITEALYRKMQMDKGCTEPGLLLKDGNYATGVGWKGYPGYGANRCTKLRIFRPKTSSERPPSVCSFDKKWRFVRQHKVTPIELAIYWDMTPINPAHEPKRSFHIDGTDFSAGPAIFHKVSSPSDDDCASMGTDLSNKNALFTNLAQTDRPKTSWEKKKSQVSTTNVNGMRRAKSAANVHIDSNSSSRSTMSNNSNSNLNNIKELCQSTPNLLNENLRSPSCEHPCEICQRPKPKVRHTKFCEVCELKARRLNIQAACPKSDFKMAFKAGVPNNQPVSTINRMNVSNLNIPKQRDPYRIKNYSIASLGVPFSLQKGKRDDYPEHWRLASVYQHSYKPVHTRKRPLLATVYQ